MVEISKVKEGLLNYLDQRVFPKLPPQKQFVAGMTIGLIGDRAVAVMREIGNREMVKALGLMDGNMIDVDRVVSAAKAQFEKQPELTIDVPLIGRLAFRVEDLRDLYHYISQ